MNRPWIASWMFALVAPMFGQDWFGLALGERPPALDPYAALRSVLPGIQDTNINPYTQVLRKFRGNLYLTYYHKSQEGFGRIITFVYTPSTKSWHEINGNQRLGDIVEAKGAVLNVSVAPTTSPAARAAGITVTKQLYLLDLYADPRIVITNPDTATILGNIPLARAGATALVITPEGGTIYVLHAGAVAGLSVIDTRLRRVTATVDLAGVTPAQTNAMAISPDGARLYIVDRGQGTAASGIVVYDPVRRTVAGRVSAPSAEAADMFRGTALSPDGSFLYAFSTRGIRVIDTATLTISNTIALSAAHAVFHPRGTRAYVIASLRLYVIDTTTSQILTFVPFGFDITSLAITPYGDAVLGWAQPSVANPTGILKTFDTQRQQVLPDQDTGVVAPAYLVAAP